MSKEELLKHRKNTRTLFSVGDDCGDCHELFEKLKMLSSAIAFRIYDVRDMLKPTAQHKLIEVYPALLRTIMSSCYYGISRKEHKEAETDKDRSANNNGTCDTDGIGESFN